MKSLSHYTVAEGTTVETTHETAINARPDKTNNKSLKTNGGRHAGSQKIDRIHVRIVMPNLLFPVERFWICSHSTAKAGW